MSGSIKNVSKKLHAAIKQVGGKVKKTGWNNFSKYHYMSESDINEAVLPALSDNGLILTTSVDTFTETPADGNNKNRFASVKLTHNIIDVESGETLTFSSVGTGADTLDKSVYKAWTGSCKYAVLKLFMISGDDSDPENDSVGKPAAEPAPAKSFAKPANPPAAKPQGFLAKKAETAPVAPVKQEPVAAPTVSKKPSFGAKKAVVEETKTNDEEDAAF